jgi:peptide/nickel transport system substrate-binding protein
MRPTGGVRKTVGFLTVVTVVALAPALGGRTAAPAAQQRIGANLIGKIEGADVVTDPARLPKTFNQAPALAELVRQRKLPPVADRLPAEPLVLKPLHAIGKYGGTWRRGFTGPADKWNGYRCCAFDTLLYVDYKGEKLVPNIAKGWKVDDGGRTFTILLRPGMKWSDGAPFTADDFMFWYEDMFLNKELNVSQSQIMSINGKPGKLEKVDAHTLRFSFPDPYHLFLDMFAAATPLGGQAYQGNLATGGFAPKHYLKQFHPRYAGKEAVDRLVKAEGYDNWVNLFKFKNDFALNVDLPVVTAWKTTIPANKPTWVLERNPYYYGVDTAGNQLPYIDKVFMTLAEDLEVLNLRAVAGEYDFQARHIDIQKLPVYVENQQRGGYKVYLDPMENGSDYGIWINLDHKADREVGKWLATLDFRRALALGINRDQINETFFLGVGVAGSAGPADNNQYNPGPEFRRRWATHDPDKANQMLDAIGLKAKDAQGYRLRTDGKGRLQLELATLGGQFVQHTQISEMVREHLKRIGIEIFVKEHERSLWGTRAASNECQLFAWGNDGTDTLFIFPFWLVPIDPTVGVGGWVSPGYGTWFASNGAKGVQPPGPMREVMALYKQGFSVPAEERVKLGKRMWQIFLDEVYHIGVVGQAGAVMGVRVVSTKMGNIPDRQANLNTYKPPAISRPQTYYFK